MKRLLALCAITMLTACSTTVPVTMNFPAVPDELTKPCPDLQKLPADTTKLSTVLGNVSKNYSQYHDCKIKVDSWKQWYDTQKQIYENLK